MVSGEYINDRFVDHVQFTFTIDHSPFTELTATGIAPDLHRISLLIPQCGNQLPDKNRRWENELLKYFCLSRIGASLADDLLLYNLSITGWP
jgi:hypothetical protein